MIDDYLFTILLGQSTLLKPKIILSSFMFRKHIYITCCTYITCNIIKREPAYNTVTVLQSKPVIFMLIKSGFWNKPKQKPLLVSKQNINKQTKIFIIPVRGGRERQLIFILYCVFFRSILK